jgi:hypothetical protein
MEYGRHASGVIICFLCCPEAEKNTNEPYLARTIKFQPTYFYHYWSNKLSSLTTKGHLTPAPADVEVRAAELYPLGGKSAERKSTKPKE